MHIAARAVAHDVARDAARACTRDVVHSVAHVFAHDVARDAVRDIDNQYRNANRRRYSPATRVAYDCRRRMSHANRVALLIVDVTVKLANSLEGSRYAFECGSLVQWQVTRLAGERSEVRILTLLADLLGVGTEKLCP